MIPGKEFENQGDILQYELNESLQLLNSVVDVLSSFVKQNSHQSLIQAFLQHLCGYIGAPAGFFLVEEQGHFVTKGALGYDEGKYVPVIPKSDRSLVWCTSEIGASILVFDINKDSRFDPEELLPVLMENPSCFTRCFSHDGALKAVLLFGFPSLPRTDLRYRMDKCSRLLSICGPQFFSRHEAIELVTLSKSGNFQRQKDLEVIFQSTGAGLILVDLDTHKVVDMNPAASGFLERSREYAMGEPFARFLTPPGQGGVDGGTPEVTELIGKAGFKQVTAFGAMTGLAKKALLCGSALEYDGKRCVLETLIPLEAT